MALAAILDFIWVTLDHLRSAIIGVGLLFKFGLDRIYSFGDIAIFWLEIAYSRLFWGL